MLKVAAGGRVSPLDVLQGLTVQIQVSDLLHI
jgi:hypothetical protein